MVPVLVYTLDMHAKNKGNIGASATIKELHKLNINVFIELGDMSKIDIIAELSNKKLVRIQCKYTPLKNGVIKLKLKKSGPNGYRYTYAEEDVDIFALYCPDTDKIYWVTSKKACECVNSFNIRVTNSKNNQKAKIHIGDEYLDFKKCIETL